MSIVSIIIIALSVLFIILFFYFLLTINNHLVKFRVTKNPMPQINKGLTNYNALENKYKYTECKQMCKQDFCDEYHTQAIKFDLCKECKKENKCYDPEEGICVQCKNNYSCEQLYGCGNKPPINPLNNYCTKCWN
jgi:hypothetical protein